MITKILTYLHAVALVYASSLLSIFEAAAIEGAAASRAISLPSKMEESPSRVEERMDYTNVIKDVEDLAERAVKAVSKVVIDLDNYDEAVNEASVINLSRIPKKRPYWSENNEHGEAALSKSGINHANANKKTRTIAEAIDVPDKEVMTVSTHNDLLHRQNKRFTDAVPKLAEFDLKDPNLLQDPLLKRFLDANPSINYQVLSVELEKTYSHETEKLSKLIRYGDNIGMRLLVERLNNWHKEFDIDPSDLTDNKPDLKYLKKYGFENVRNTILNDYEDVASYQILLRELKYKLGFDELAKLLLAASEKSPFVKMVGTNLEKELIESWFRHCLQEQVRELLQLRNPMDPAFFNSPTTRLYLLYITQSSPDMQIDCLDWLSRVSGGCQKALQSAANGLESNQLLLLHLQKDHWKSLKLHIFLGSLELGKINFSMYENRLFQFWMEFACVRNEEAEAVQILVKKAMKDYLNYKYPKFALNEVQLELLDINKPKNIMLNAAANLFTRLKLHKDFLIQIGSWYCWTKFTEGFKARARYVFGILQFPILQKVFMECKTHNDLALQRFASELVAYNHGNPPPN